MRFDFLSEKLVLPKDYTKDIEDAIKDIKYKMDYTLTKYSDSDIRVFQHSDSIYILANPQLGTEPIFDEFENVIQVPLYNITLIYPPNWKMIFEDNQIKFKMPIIRIMRPELCVRIVHES